MSKTEEHLNRYVLLPILAGTCWGLAGVFVRELAKAGLDNPTIVFTRTSVCALLTLLYILIADRRRKPADSGQQSPADSGQQDRPRSLLYMQPRDLPYAAAIAVFGSVLLMIAYNIAAISLSALETNMSQDEIEAALPKVKETADRISSLIGYDHLA